MKYDVRIPDIDRSIGWTPDGDCAPGLIYFNPRADNVSFTIPRADQRSLHARVVFAGLRLFDVSGERTGVSLAFQVNERTTDYFNLSDWICGINVGVDIAPRSGYIFKLRGVSEPISFYAIATIEELFEPPIVEPPTLPFLERVGMKLIEFSQMKRR